MELLWVFRRLYFPHSILFVRPTSVQEHSCCSLYITAACNILLSEYAPSDPFSWRGTFMLPTPPAPPLQLEQLQTCPQISPCAPVQAFLQGMSWKQDCWGGGNTFNFMGPSEWLH